MRETEPLYGNPPKRGQHYRVRAHTAALALHVIHPLANSLTRTSLPLGHYWFTTYEHCAACISVSNGGIKRRSI